MSITPYQGNGNRNQEEPASPGDLLEMFQAKSYGIAQEAIRAEIDSQIATAKNYPRSIKRFMAELETLACLNADVAKGCMYSLPRAGKQIVGPSVRFFELVAYAFGNLRTTARILEEGSRFIVGEATAIDLEKNVGVKMEVRRRITDSRGARYNDDMMGVAAAACISIALRNAIRHTVPEQFWLPIFNKVKKTAVGNRKSIEDLREEWLSYWMEKGLKAEEIFNALGIKGKPELQLEHIERLIGFDTAIEQGETTLDAIFRPSPEEASPPPQEAKVERLTGNLKRAKEASQKAPQARVQRAPKGPADDQPLLRSREPGEEG